MTSPNWTPPRTLEEAARAAVVPASVYVRYRALRERRHGEKELGLLPFLMPAGKRAIDIGANVGVWSYWLSRYGARTEAYEPNPKIFTILRQARLPGVTCHAIALSAEEGTARLLVPKGSRGYSNQGASLSATKVTGEHGIVEVESRRLDTSGFDDVGFMKIDVEGHGLAVLKGAAETIARCRPNLVIEMEENHTKRPIEEQIAEVESYGYLGFALKDGALTRTSHIDFDRFHRTPKTRADYIFNFAFLPR
jgi:FkbM family methyltransferase